MVISYFGLLFALYIQGVFSQAKAKIHVDEKAGNLHVSCKEGTLMKGGIVLKGKEEDLNLGSLWNDPRGLYSCNTTGSQEFVHVYVRRCMNCIELDPGTIAGFIVADAIMIFLIATAVYFVSGSEIRRPGRASDKQNLIERDADYQALGRRDNEQYSRLAPRPNRGAF
ncbi:T-cell surface glycoprotein CD3 gamma chain-like [Dendropsophus ebraccatus]|uniref:T-cell surface glycoprotein CD3 gamma chain-like n=1 Tax=Dendropsophus ebraccatus TaxID=150705 RepID=UPI003831AFBD